MLHYCFFRDLRLLTCFVVILFANRICLNAVRNVVFNPKMAVCRGIQTIAYTIVNGSYVQKAPSELQDKVKVFFCLLSCYIWIAGDNLK